MTLEEGPEYQRRLGKTGPHNKARGWKETSELNTRKRRDVGKSKPKIDPKYEYTRSQYQDSKGKYSYIL